MFAASVFIVMVKFFLCISFDVQKERTKERRTQDVVDIMQWNCLACQQSTSSCHPFFQPKPRNCPHQIDPFPARNNPSNAYLCILPPALLSANRLSPLNETLFQSARHQMKWRLAHCTKASLWRLVIVWPFKGGPHWSDSYFFHRRLWIVFPDNP